MKAKGTLTGITMISGSTVIMAWHIIKFQMEEKASRYGRKL
jgi:hypothetical protein